jgi:hypothetical protein
MFQERRRLAEKAKRPLVRGGAGNLNTAMSGNSALWAGPRTGLARSKEHEQETTQEPFAGLQGEGGH